MAAPAVGLSLQGMRSADMCGLAEDRINEAVLLLANHHYTGAAYIAGYAVEFYLKAILARQQYAGFWPLDNIVNEHRTHDLEDLLTMCGLKDRMRTASKTNIELAINWQALRDWRPDIRYRRLRRRLAEDIVGAVTDTPNGVAHWLRFFQGEG